MNRSELSQVVSRLSSAANKRLKRIGEYFEKRGYGSTVGDIEQQRFGAKGKSINALRSEMARLRGFFDRKTSTVRGVKQVEREFTNRVSEKTGYQPSDFTPDQLSRFWHAYIRAEQMGIFTGVYGDSDKAQKAVFQSWAQNPNESIDSFIERFRLEIEEQYQQTNGSMGVGSNGVSSFFA
jgi:hypothetical protein